jgi:uncharacterized membrane protein
MRIFYAPNFLCSGLLWAALGSGACSFEATQTLRACPTPEQPPSWAQAELFLAKHCLRCHSAAAVGRARGGAPAASNFETQEQVDRALVRLFWRAADERTSMPPAPPRPSAGERRAFGDYLSCRLEQRLPKR